MAQEEARPAENNGLLAANLACLEVRNPGLARRLAETRPVAVEVLPTREEGSPTLRFTDQATGKKALLHSRLRPQQEAEEAVSCLDFQRVRLVGVAGLGCGYYVRGILRRIHPQSAVVVLETNLPLLRAALESVDLTDVLASPRVMLVDATQADLKSALQDILISMLYLGLRVDFFTTPVYGQLWPETCKKLREDFLSTISYLSLILGNSPGDTLQGMDQIFANIPFLLTSPAPEPAREGFAGLPAFCVAAGPSLNKNIHWLKEGQHQGLVICADTILERLLQEDIVPDIVCCLERGQIVYDYFFKDKGYPPQVTLAGQSVIWPKIFGTFPGPMMVCLKETLPLEEWIGSMLGYLPLFRAGSSVGNMNFGLARYLGCDPIVLVGQDLAYGDEGESHAAGTIYENTPAPAASPPPEEEEYILGKNGRLLRTRKWWKAFHHWFEIEIPRTTARCLDATEGGALIHGAEITTLREVVAACSSWKPKMFGDTLVMPPREEMDARIRALKNGLEDQRQRIGAVRHLLKEAGRNLNHLEADLALARRRGGKVAAGKYMRRVQGKIEAMPGESRLFAFIVQALTARLNWTLAAKLEGVRNAEELVVWSETYRDFVDKVDGVAAITEEVLAGGLRTVERINIVEV